MESMVLKMNRLFQGGGKHSKQTDSRRMKRCKGTFIVFSLRTLQSTFLFLRRLPKQNYIPH